MRSRLILLNCAVAAFVSCSHDFDNSDAIATLEKEQAQKALGVNIDNNQDWMMTSNGIVTISNFPSDIKTVSLFTMPTRLLTVRLPYSMPELLKDRPFHWNCHLI